MSARSFGEPPEPLHEAIGALARRPPSRSRRARAASSESMNQRAVSAPWVVRMSSGSTVFCLDFDIFSIGADLALRSPVEIRNARRASPMPSILTLAGQASSPASLAIGLVHDHALGEQAVERLVECRRGRSSSSRGRRSANRADAGSRARCRRYTGRPAANNPPSADRSGVGSQRRGEAREIPGRIDEGVHRVGLASPGRRSCGQATCFQVGWRSSGLPGVSKVDILGQRDRQIGLRHRHHAAGRRSGSTGIGQPQ